MLIDDADWLLIVALKPATVTVLPLGEKLEPEIVTAVPGKAFTGVTLDITGTTNNVYGTWFDALPQELVTSTLPEQTPVNGSVAIIVVGVQLTMPIGVLPILTLPLLVKLLPAIITLLPGVPLAGDTLEIKGTAVSVYATRLEAVPQLLVTSIFPEQTPFRGRVAVMAVGVQLTTFIAVLPIFTEPLLVKFVPAIVILLPGAPLAGETFTMEGTTLSV